MHTILALVVFAVAIAAAARSTWSPCGRSMLSSITPLGEVGRGHRFGSTAAWFVAGAVLGGATLGAAMAGLAAAVAVAGPPPAVTAGGAAVACVAAAAADLGLVGPPIPWLRRQVNEVWLDRYRSWVYGAGFGWQIGVGFTTFVMTAAVVALVLLGALTASPLAALGAGVVFGTLRGLTVLIGRSVRDPAALQAAHRRLDRLGTPVRLGAVAVLAAAAGVLSLWAWAPAAAAVAVVAVAAAARRRVRPARTALRA